MANLIDHPERSDFDTMNNIIESSSLTILRILSISTNNGNVLFDHHTLTDAAVQSVTIMKDVASNVLNTILPLYKIITVLVLTIVLIMLIVTIVFIIRCHLRRKKRKLDKQAVKHLKNLLNLNNDYIIPEDLPTIPRRQRDAHIV